MDRRRAKDLANLLGKRIEVIRQGLTVHEGILSYVPRGFDNVDSSFYIAHTPLPLQNILNVFDLQSYGIVSIHPTCDVGVVA